MIKNYEDNDENNILDIKSIQDEAYNYCLNFNIIVI
jgi:hypothetical protein